MSVSGNTQPNWQPIDPVKLELTFEFERHDTEEVRDTMYMIGSLLRDVFGESVGPINVLAYHEQPSAEQGKPAATTECGADFASWFTRGMWPRCKCGFAPRDNAVLNQHWADAGFRVVDEGGRLVHHPLTEQGVGK